MKGHKSHNIKNTNFIEYHKKILPESDFRLFVEALQSPKRISIRVNTLKISSDELLRRLQIDATPIPWNAEGFWIDKSVAGWIGKTLSHALGYYYIQDATSMIPPVVLSASPGEKVLDMCAAPGSKTTQIGIRMPGRGTIIANDVSAKRTQILSSNIQRLGITNAVVYTTDGVHLPRYGQLYDKILIDAPCSAVGTDMKAIYQWSERTVHRLSRLQKKLILSGFRMLVEGGVLVYSTCTTSIEENEEVVEHLLQTFRGEAVLEEIRIPGLRYIPGLTKPTEKAIRVLPHFYNTGSVFVARIRRVSGPREKKPSFGSKIDKLAGDFYFLTRSEKQSISHYLQERFGYRIPKSMRLIAKGKRRHKKYVRVFAFSGDTKNLLGLPIENIGLFMGTWEDGEFRPSLEGCEVFGKPRRNVVWLNEDETRMWMRGKNLPKSMRRGCYIVGYNGILLGGAFADGRSLINFLPKVFNIDVLK